MGLSHCRRAGRILTDSLFKTNLHKLRLFTVDAAGRSRLTNPFQFTGNTEANNSEVITSEIRVPSDELLNQSCINQKLMLNLYVFRSFLFRVLVQRRQRFNFFKNHARSDKRLYKSKLRVFNVRKGTRPTANQTRLPTGGRGDTWCASAPPSEL